MRVLPVLTAETINPPGVHSGTRLSSGAPLLLLDLPEREPYRNAKFIFSVKESTTVFQKISGFKDIKFSEAAFTAQPNALYNFSLAALQSQLPQGTFTGYTVASL